MKQNAEKRCIYGGSKRIILWTGSCWQGGGSREEEKKRANKNLVKEYILVSVPVISLQTIVL